MRYQQRSHDLMQSYRKCQFPTHCRYRLCGRHRRLLLSEPASYQLIPLLPVLCLLPGSEQSDIPTRHMIPIFATKHSILNADTSYLSRV